MMERTKFAQKTPGQIERIKRAVEITDEIFGLVIKNWNKFKTEKDVEKFVLNKFEDYKVKPSFPPIIASGKNAVDPHAGPKDEKLQKGFCVIDMGVVYKGYCSDMTRTVYIGSPNQKERDLYKKVLNSQKKSTKQAQIGVKASDLDKFCRDILGKRLSALFIHGLGHGVGKNVHEYPRINSKSDAILEENMIITIEPGVYKKDKYGIRIEDDILVTKKEPVVLNKTSKELLIID